MPEKNALYYADYLKLDQLLTAQVLESEKQGEPKQDEMLFIIAHQVYELWFKQICHELAFVQKDFSEPRLTDDRIARVLQRLERIIKIQTLLVEQISVLKTMTPMDFLEFRHCLTPASGLQSVQFRVIERMLGVPLENGDLTATSYYNSLSDSDQQHLHQVTAQPSLFSLVEDWLERMPVRRVGDFDFWESYRQAIQAMLLAQETSINNDQTLSPEQRALRERQFGKESMHFENLFDSVAYEKLRDYGERRLSYTAMQAAVMIYLYRDQPLFHLPFQVLSALSEIDELWSTWRHQHALLVQRLVGARLGTGGSSGYEYLQSTIERSRVFSDFAVLATALVPRDVLPPLPEALKQQMGFHPSVTQ